MSLAQHADSSTRDPVALERRGWEDLRHRRYAPARCAFEDALAANESQASAREGLAAAARCLDDLTTMRVSYERAYRDFLDQGDVRGAARAATHLAVYHEAYRKECAIANGWFERAQTLLETASACPEHAWLEFWKAHVHIHLRGDLVEGERHLEEAIRASQACSAGGELDLLVKGLGGLMLISEGRVRDGLRRLDETTTAAVAGELTSPGTIGWAYCYILDACENVRDFGRAAEWIRKAFDTVGELGVQHQTALCRSHYIGVLTWRGEYAKAEEETAAMRRELAGIAPFYEQLFGDVRLGEIQRRRGRLDDATVALEPHAHNPLAMLSLAALALDAGRSADARERCERYLRGVSPGDRVRRLHGLDLLIRADAALGETAALAAALTELEAVAGGAATPHFQAILLEGRAYAAEAAADLETARRLLEDAVDAYERGGVPYEAAAARLRLGDVLLRTGRHDAARKTLEAALAGAGRIGAERLSQRATTLLTRARGAGRKGSSAGLTGRELEVLALVAQGVSNQEIGDRLCISGFTVKRHIANILTKLNVPTRAAAAAYAVREGIVA